MPAAALSPAEITARLDRCLDVEFTFLRTEEPAAVIGGLPPARQRYILEWTERVAATNVQLAYRFITRAIAALDRLDREVIEAWALHAMDTYDQQGLHAALAVIEDVEAFVHLVHARTAGVVLADSLGVLTHFAHGLAGRPLALAEGESPWTDTETIFLPPLLARLPAREDNFLLYKALVARLWAQARFGTFRHPLSQAAAASGEPEAFLARFHALESLRLAGCIGRELPGLARDMERLRRALGEPPLPPDWQALAAELGRPGTGVERVLELAARPLVPPPPGFLDGTLDVAAVEACMQARVARERAQLRTVLRDVAEELTRGDERAPEALRFGTRREPDPGQPDGERITLTLDAEPVPVPEVVHRLTTSIVQDLGQIPDDYLVPAGDGEYDPSLLREQEPDPDDVWKGTYHEEGAFLYDEWDHRRRHYRKNWCAVREKDVTPVHDDFAARTLARYRGFIKHLRKTFEAMRDEDRVLKRQVHGDEVDIDALVEALADARDGREMSDRLFTRVHRSERDIAVCFMVDMSGSTQGWINDAERESLLLLAETLETLGDRYAIYGFSGMARKKCEIFRIKTFDEPYCDEVRARISGITPQDYTRMGFAIRHLTRMLGEVAARTRILVALSDGKPDDYDRYYRGEYGIEDTRRALVEARRAGIHPYCITIDREARDYLPRMYGPAAFTVIDDVRQLPLKVADIYRRLTT